MSILLEPLYHVVSQLWEFVLSEVLIKGVPRVVAILILELATAVDVLDGLHPLLRQTSGFSHWMVPVHLRCTCVAMSQLR